MPRKAKQPTNTAMEPNKQSGTPNGNPPLQWINVYLNDADQQWLEDHSSEQFRVVMEFMDALVETDNLSLKHDVQSGRWLAVLFTHSTDGNGTKCGLSMRAGQPGDAVYALAYTVMVKLDGAIVPASVDSTRRFG